MFKVQYRGAGQGLWNLSASPMTMQAAFGHARAVVELQLGSDIRFVPSTTGRSAPVRLLDILA